jgi:hypothetical protein
MAMEKNVVQLPIFLNHRVLVAGNGFFAGITMKGRVLAEIVSPNECWIYGVNPGGISATGKNLEEAHNAFSKRFHSALFDIAGETSDFSGFKGEAVNLVTDTNLAYETLWLAAVKDVRKGRVDDPSLPRESGTTPIAIEVVKIAKPDASHNPSEGVSLAGRAA